MLLSGRLKIASFGIPPFHRCRRKSYVHSQVTIVQILAPVMCVALILSAKSPALRGITNT